LNAFRGCVLAAVFAAIALCVVHLRAERTRCASRLLALESRGIELRRELWNLQTRTARLRSPERIRSRVAMFQTGLVPPGYRAPSAVTERLALNGKKKK